MAEVYHLPFRHKRKNVQRQQQQQQQQQQRQQLRTILMRIIRTLHMQPMILIGFLMLFRITNATPTSIYTHCSSNQFTCKDGSCILQEKMCDGRLDCSDNSDELDCDAKMCRKPNWFACAQPHGPCLASELICNGIENCPGGEDELDCINRPRVRNRFDTVVSSASADVGTGGWHPRNCTAYEYTCQSDKSCIPLDFMCDGKSDCHDGSDEVAGCIKAMLNCRGFFCANTKCLESPKWRCDGVDDCGDGSDEKNCANSCSPEVGKFFCRNNVTCLELNKVCDGQKDCPDESDESHLCSSATENCSTKKCPPAAKCQMLPETGPECICPKGFRISMLNNVCIDIDECLENYGICSQNCENTAGKYKCTCDKGYELLADNKTCQAHGEEPLLLYSTQVAVMGVHLRSKRVFAVSQNLTKVIGVAYDGKNIYWTNIQNEAESIVKANPDGSEKEILLTSGLDAPEDLAVDWLTNNIYFSDNIMHHIAACSNSGLYCVVLVTVDVHQPRGIALWPQRSLMFWTDWGIQPMIARAFMDGSQSSPIVTRNIHWPNGIALDMHNNRIYWVDAKLATIESVRSDGTDRRLVLGEILKHPYGLAIFEDNIYWSDWGTKSVHKCDKFTGKNHKVVVRDRTIYSVHIYHSAKQPKVEHACMNTRCSHLCLLSENNRFTCACPEGMQLSADQLRCVKTRKKQRLFIGIKNSLLEMEHTTFGRHTIAQTHQLPFYIHELTYNSVNGSIIVADNIQRAIFEYDMINNKITTLARGNLGNITGLAFDYLSHNVYWTDAERHVVEVYSMHTRHRAIVSFFSGMEVPIGISIIPDDGVMFIALRSHNHVHIDQEPLNGRGEHKHLFEDELGDKDIEFAADFETKTLYWADSSLGRISFSDYRDLRAYTFRGRLQRPYSIAVVEDDLFWSELKSTTIHWTHKSNLGPLKHVEIQVAKEMDMHIFPAQIPLLASTSARIVEHPCQHSNGGCSHICVTLGKFSGSCLCPAGLVFKDGTNHTCIETLDCEFRCNSGECLTLSRRCNGRKDCPDNSDEMGCDAESIKHPKIICGISEFMCHDATQCIDNDKRCNEKKDCHDGSDEEHCEKFDKNKKCHRHQHVCDNGNCVDFSTMCDGIDDCGDFSDESNCGVGEGKMAGSRPICDRNMFQCNSGTCIAKSWECDGKLDCTDASDEHEKCDLKECPKNMHKCLLGQCIDSVLVCDGHNDCGDYSDELNCDLTTGKKQKVTCGDEQHPMFQCSSDANLCLELTAKCNGTAECPRGEDEANCGNICSIYEFQCKKSGQCIRKEFQCDHDKDCSDGSDEQNCEHLKANQTKLSHEKPCEAHMFDCKDGQCVDLTRVCDGFPDCDSGIDEGLLCKTSCKSTTSNPICQHKCRPGPNGAVCSCFNGYRLNLDQRTCSDIDECTESDPCAQICENTQGSYRCSCYPDFMLRPDKTTCKSIESNSTLMFSTYNEVRSMSEQPIVLRVMWTANDSKINGFDMNVRQRQAYFTTDNEDILYMVDLGSGAIKAGLAVKMPTKVAVDWITDNIYVISRSQRYEIKACSFAAKMCGSILQANPRETIKTLTVDAYNRRIFYVIIRSQSFNLPFSQVFISDLDGKKREMLVATKNGGYITAIATDPHKKILYYADVHAKSLQAISYKLGSSRNPTTLIQKGNVVMHLSSMSVYENQAFMVNIGAKEAIRCQLYGERKCKAFNLNILNAEDVVVDGASRQPLATNPCDMAKCSGLCVQAEYGYECMCGDAIVGESVVCSKHLSNEIIASALLKNPYNDDVTATDGRHAHTVTIVVVSLLVLTTIGIVIGYLYYRRFTQGHRDFNINLHFQNPLSSAATRTNAVPDGKSSAMYNEDTLGRRYNNNNNKNTPTAPPPLSYNAAECEKSQFNMPIYRFLRGKTSSSGSEILLETKKPKKGQQQSHEIHSLGQNQRMSSVMLEDDSDYDEPGTPRNYDDGDEANARLVP